MPLHNIIQVKNMLKKCCQCKFYMIITSQKIHNLIKLDSSFTNIFSDFLGVTPGYPAKP
jgi:hypothetical protein